jgi:phenylalanyl-tRNA synthetase beta chain
MRVALSWLREFVEPGDSVEALAQVLGMGGLAVDAIETAGEVDAEVCVGRVLAVGPHPQADRLAVCRVDTGAGEPRTIVSGAPGLVAGGLVAVALPGARLAGGRVVEAVAVRGVASGGVLCSEEDLGLGEDASAVLGFEDTARPGAAVRDLPGVRDVVLDIDVTPNRGDCLSVMGIAREVAVDWQARAAPACA